MDRDKSWKTTRAYFILQASMQACIIVLTLVSLHAVSRSLRDQKYTRELHATWYGDQTSGCVTTALTSKEQRLSRNDMAAHWSASLPALVADIQRHTSQSRPPASPPHHSKRKLAPFGKSTPPKSLTRQTTEERTDATC
mmetsp:Transcript_16114/g.38674  ORF Transcript_16114/g.38674 Transcript_16114/m.38674 type:complete len:139 (+) Transcript_16114:145-561(+)